MADNDTEEWALKSKKIEAERLKAVHDLENQKPDKTNLAYLEPKATKVKGWSSDPDVILANTERMGNRALILAITGSVLGLIGYVGEEVAFTNKLGPGSIIISGLPSGIGSICLGVAVLLGLIAIGREVYLKIKRGVKFSSTFWTGVSAIILVAIFLTTQRFLF